MINQYFSGWLPYQTEEEKSGPTCPTCSTCQPVHPNSAAFSESLYLNTQAYYEWFQFDCGEIVDKLCERELMGSLKLLIKIIYNYERAFSLSETWVHHVTVAAAALRPDRLIMLANTTLLSPRKTNDSNHYHGIV